MSSEDSSDYWDYDSMAGMCCDDARDTAAREIADIILELCVKRRQSVDDVLALLGTGEWKYWSSSQ